MQNLASFFHKFLRINSTSVGNRYFFPDDATISLMVSSERRLASLIDPLDWGEVSSSSRPETPVSPELWALPSPLSLKSATAFALTAEALVSYKSEDAITGNEESANAISLRISNETAPRLEPTMPNTKQILLVKSSLHGHCWGVSRNFMSVLATEKLNYAHMPVCGGHVGPSPHASEASVVYGQHRSNRMSSNVCEKGLHKYLWWEIY